eukprot:jgi/Tetstr1/445397/TSEL_033181.t1
MRKTEVCDGKLVDRPKFMVLRMPRPFTSSQARLFGSMSRVNMSTKVLPLGPRSNVELRDITSLASMKRQLQRPAPRQPP